LARIKFAQIKQIIVNYFLVSIIFIVSSCSNISTIKTRTSDNTNPLLRQYKNLRRETWRSYTNKKNKPPRRKIINKKKASISLDHLKNNPIFQQVTQIHCFKIRATNSRCEAIKYLAMINCGEINHESEIKKYTRCLERNFK
jgi:hypothetical protein